MRNPEWELSSEKPDCYEVTAAGIPVSDLNYDQALCLARMLTYLDLYITIGGRYTDGRVVDVEYVGETRTLNSKGEAASGENSKS